MSKHSMQVVNKAATLIALSAKPAMPSAAPDIAHLHVQSSCCRSPEAQEVWYRCMSDPNAGAFRLDSQRGSGHGRQQPQIEAVLPQPHAQHPIEPPLHWLNNATAARCLQQGQGFVRCSVGDAAEKKRFTFHVSLGTLEDPNRCVSSRRDVSLQRWIERIRASSGGLYQKHSKRALGARSDTNPARTLDSMRKRREALMR